MLSRAEAKAMFAAPWLQPTGSLIKNPLVDTLGHPENSIGVPGAQKSKELCCLVEILLGGDDKFQLVRVA
jgi:hypothetical protein